MPQLQVDPTAINEKYKERLAEATHSAMMWESAADVLHSENTQLKDQVAELQRQNKALMEQTGRAELEGDEVDDDPDE